MPICGIDVYQVQFPSPIVSAHTQNNTVHAEYYWPKCPGPFPGVVILDITAGDQSLSRTIATVLAQNRIAGLFVQMAYYGPRRPPGSRLQLLSADYQHTIGAVRQTVLDVRRAAAWLDSRPEIDHTRTAILGTSLGGFVAALAAEMEPRFQRVVILLAGGGLVEAYYDHPRASLVRKVYEACGGSKQKLAEIVAPVDPITHAANLRNRSVLMIGAKRDEVVPRRATVALWKAAGEPRILWYDCTHTGAVLYLVPALEEVIQHLNK
jgi:dienelactone hydrolase